MSSHWAGAYIGLPWARDGEGPDAYHCWSFVRHILAAHFDLAVPRIPYSEDLIALARVFRDHPERRRWDEVSMAEVRPGDAVLLRQARYPIHIGVWLAEDGGGVLHCSRDSGVVYQSSRALRVNGWQIAGIYRFQGAKYGQDRLDQESVSAPP